MYTCDQVCKGTHSSLLAKKYNHHEFIFVSTTTASADEELGCSHVQEVQVSITLQMNLESYTLITYLGAQVALFKSMCILLKQCFCIFAKTVKITSMCVHATRAQMPQLGNPKTCVRVCSHSRVPRCLNRASAQARGRPHGHTVMF